MKITFRFRLVLELRPTSTVEELKYMSTKIYVSSTPLIDMASSLDKLVSYLPAENFSLLDNRFPQHFSEDLQLLHQKGFHPCSSFDSNENFQENSLPSVEKWTNSLEDGHVSITPANFQHATKEFQKFGCENLGSYRDLYLTTDSLLLAYVVEKFRNSF